MNLILMRIDTKELMNKPVKIRALQTLVMHAFFVRNSPCEWPAITLTNLQGLIGLFLQQGLLLPLHFLQLIFCLTGGFLQ